LFFAWYKLFLIIKYVYFFFEWRKEALIGTGSKSGYSKSSLRAKKLRTH
jgi:hypothetical protein